MGDHCLYYSKVLNNRCTDGINFQIKLPLPCHKSILHVGLFDSKKEAGRDVDAFFFEGYA